MANRKFFWIILAIFGIGAPSAGNLSIAGDAEIRVGRPADRARAAVWEWDRSAHQTETSLREKWKDLGLIYSNDDSRALNELWLLGRYHGQYHWSKGSHGEDEGYESRRLRAGFQARFLKSKATLHAQAISGPNLEPSYGGFTELWLSWQFCDALALTVGQQKHRFTHDRNISSRYISGMERTLLTNNFAVDYTPAVTASGRMDRLSYYAGVFSNATQANIGRAFTHLDSGWTFLAAATYDLGGALGTDTAHGYVSCYQAHLDQRGHPTNFTRFDSGVSASLILTEGPASLVTEIAAGQAADGKNGQQGGDAWGFFITPTFFITDEMELVGRYQFACAEESSGLRAQRRYEREAGLSRGENYQAFYLGLNYYLAGHRLKLLSGLEYSALDDRDVWTGWTGMRFFFGPHSNAPFPAVDPLPGVF